MKAITIRMGKFSGHIVQVLVLVTLAGCSVIQPARMVLPQDLAQHHSVIGMTGAGGGTEGNFQLGEGAGYFHRSSSRLQLFDIYDGRGARLAFSFAGTDGECLAKERQLNFDIINFSPKPMAYACSFNSGGKQLPSHLELQEAKEGIAGAMNQAARRGEFVHQGNLLKIRSVHAVQGSPLLLRLPIGYLFHIDGRAIGAVEINGGITVILATGQTPEVRHAVELASLALGLFWDPGEYDD